MQITPYLDFTGNAEEALNFYKSALGGSIEFMLRHGESPGKDQVDAAWHSKIMHATFSAEGAKFHVSDKPPNRGGAEAFSGFWLSISLVDVTKGEAHFNALANGGSVSVPFGPTFWAKGFGMLKDQFGVHWIVNCE